MTFTETRRHERHLLSRQPKFRCAPSKSLAPIPMSGFWVWRRARRGQTNPSPQEIITVRYFPDFSRAVVLERERTCKEVENCHQPTLTGNFLSRIPPWKLWKSTVSSTWSQPTTHTWFAHNRKSVAQSYTYTIQAPQTGLERDNIDLIWPPGNISEIKKAMEPPQPVDVYTTHTQQSFEATKHPKYPPVSLFNNNLPMTYSPSSLR